MGVMLATDAMLIVGGHEIIPAPHRTGHEIGVTMDVLSGILMMMVLDIALG
jgi:zinc transporter ZupT